MDFYEHVSPSRSPIYPATDPSATEERPERGSWGSRRKPRSHVDRFDRQDRERQIIAGIFPGYAASVQDLKSGKWIAVIFLYSDVKRYRRKESFARFESSAEAFDAAERWLKREVAR